MKPRPVFDHPIHELLRKRWSPRAFSSQPVSEQNVLTLFEAARWAASAMNEQPWRFIVTRREETEIFQKLAACLNDANRVWAEHAPVLVLTLVQTLFERNNKPNPWAKHDLGLAVGHLTLQASAMNLYVHNMAGFSADKAKETFALPETLEPVTMIALGYLGEAEALPEPLRQREMELQTRKSLKTLLRL